MLPLGHDRCEGAPRWAGSARRACRHGRGDRVRARPLRPWMEQRQRPLVARPQSRMAAAKRSMGSGEAMASMGLAGARSVRSVVWRVVGMAHSHRHRGGIAGLAFKSDRSRGYRRAGLAEQCHNNRWHRLPAAVADSCNMISNTFASARSGTICTDNTEQR